MSTNFSIPLNGRDPSTLLEKAKAEAASHSFTFSGDDHSGNFAGKGVSGAYAVSQSDVVVSIDKKPFFLPMSVIESAVNELFS
jgi:hypothetical protein